jgi:hypothetical protein
MPNNTNITPPRVPLTNPETGLIAREWYLFLLSLFNQTGNSLVSLDDVQKGPPAEAIDPNAILSAAQISSGILPSDLGPILTALQALEASQQAAFDPTNLQSSIQALEALQQTAFDPTNLQASIQALEVAPAYTPQLPRLRYGSFYDTTDQTAAAINTAYAMTFNSTDITQGVYIGTPTSRVYVDTHNVYNIQFSAQFVNTAGGTHNVWVWLRKNGTDVANSATTLRLQGNNAEAVAAWNFLLDMNAGDYFELMWEVSDTAASLFSDPATAVHPAIPSIILTVTDNISSRGAT